MVGTTSIMSPLISVYMYFSGKWTPAANKFITRTMRITSRVTLLESMVQERGSNIPAQSGPMRIPNKVPMTTSLKQTYVKHDVSDSCFSESCWKVPFLWQRMRTEKSWEKNKKDSGLDVKWWITSTTKPPMTIDVRPTELTWKACTLTWTTTIKVLGSPRVKLILCQKPPEDGCITSWIWTGRTKAMFLPLEPHRYQHVARGWY